ncbi:MAG: TIGR02391 family protein [Bdellovibrionaceae bacterium]|nr:TIGR02391 family protein [Pseudobdellovibrionaceae bacterium]
MANLTLNEKRTLEVLLRMENGKVLNFTNENLHYFFEELGVEINHYHHRPSGLIAFSEGRNDLAYKAAAVLNFFSRNDDQLVGETILKFIEYIKHEIDLEKLAKRNFPEKRLIDAQNIAHKLLGKTSVKIKNLPQTVFSDNIIDIALEEDVFKNVQKLLNNGDYYNALGNAYKVVAGKLKDITGHDRPTDAFSKKNWEEAWGYKEKEAKKDNFLQGMKHLLMAIQRFRNEIAHPPLKEIEKNLALHYIALVSLAYKLMLSVDIQASNKK